MKYFISGVIVKIGRDLLNNTHYTLISGVKYCWTNLYSYCDKCDKKFVSRHALKNHVLQVHEGIKFAWEVFNSPVSHLNLCYSVGRPVIR